MFDSFIFQDVVLTPGDRVSIVAKSVPAPCFQATIQRGDASSIVVFSTQLVIFQHSGTFTLDDVTELVLDYPAERAVPMESRADLQYCQQVTVPSTCGDRRFHILGAFDGVVVAYDKNSASPEEAYITGGSSFFVPV